MKVKQRISQKISALLLNVKDCAALPLLISAEQHINSASALLTLTENNGKLMAMSTVVKSPSNQLVTTQRWFFTTRSARKKQCTSLNKPSSSEKKEVIQCLLEDKSLYIPRSYCSINQQTRCKLYALYRQSQIRKKITFTYLVVVCHISDILISCCKVTSLDKVQKGYKIHPSVMISDLPDEVIEVDFLIPSNNYLQYQHGSN